MMQLDPKAIEQVTEFLLATQDCAKLAKNGTEVTFRCPFCGDSRSSRSTTSFSVCVKPDDGKPMVYQCFRAACKAKGVVNQDFLTKLGFSKYDVMREIGIYNSKVAKNSNGNYIFKSKIKKQLVNVVSKQDSIAYEKLGYLSDRMGVKFTFEDLLRFKINLDFISLLKFNEIEILEKHEYWYKLLSTYGISFISAYNDYVVIRDISAGLKTGKRYTNINIFNNYDNVTKFYTIPSKINLLSTEPVVLNVSEGSFDILGIYLNTDIDRNYKNHIFAAASGAGINNVILHFIQMYGLLDLKINVFSDADVDKHFYEPLYSLKPYLNDFNITIYYNTLEKDFGVRKNRIKYISSKL